jgi:succinate dehydrogenase / fumarate reductase flavoprotein subunit
VAVGEASMQSALERRETRGCHYRSDYPALDETLQVNLHCRARGDGEGRLEVWPEPVPAVPEELRPWIEQSGALAVATRLLE